MTGDDVTGAPEVRVRLVVEGRVQGVGFRYRCEQQAHELGVRGWVRNRRDGAVEIVAEGARSKVDQLTVWCHDGPQHASVTRVTAVDEPVVGELGFRVRGSA